MPMSTRFRRRCSPSVSGSSATALHILRYTDAFGIFTRITLSQKASRANAGCSAAFARAAIAPASVVAELGVVRRLRTSPVSKFISELCNRGRLWLQRTSEVGRFEGIVLADLRNSGNQTEHFRDTFLASLRLLQRTDPRRFARVQRHIAWITNCTLSHGGAEYYHSVRSCFIDFQEPAPPFDAEYLIGWYACTLVHEATHGVICSRGILYTPALRERIECLCVREEQRFLRRLATTEPELAARIDLEFVPSDWNWYWGSTPFERFTAQMTRILTRGNKREQEGTREGLIIRFARPPSGNAAVAEAKVPGKLLRTVSSSDFDA